MKAETDRVIEELEKSLANARPIPLTDQVRLNLKEAQRLIAELREALAAERGTEPVQGR
jgi:hypothetical protein